MNKYGYFVTALILGFLIDTCAETLTKVIENGYNSELKAGEYGSFNITKKEVELVNDV